ncbi:Carboxypeptidase regulatory-like domain-containing protein [Marinobacter sp. DSM 26671]|uniref:carboxypeptidase-like regulatory domain-containing protein n=1 Tax=Marinobacter sp. DSM 26671 TaxID=1761793 RepID=UPI0008E2CAD0|nr:carboxypeptidase-like regulatory domain-containing protein [Marinobacter sp. DSM 26671]SFF06169.1 Carboxypeptidase regulatory-like domain-containing protein [Marinobacter sp. DSM 26671]
MLRLIVLFSSLLTISLIPLQTYASNNGTAACEALPEPFQQLATMTLDPSVENPPQVGLCHRVANAEKHFEKGSDDKAIQELNKYIAGINQGSGKSIEESYAAALVSEAERVISIISGTFEPDTMAINGGVFGYSDQAPVAEATVTVSFIESGSTFTVTTDSNGLFSITDLTESGVYVANVTTSDGRTGSAQGSLLETESSSSVLVTVDLAGSSAIYGTVFDSSGQPVPGALVTAIFPDTDRKYSTTSSADGSFSLMNVHGDGTLLLVGFKNDTGASGSTTGVLSSYTSQITRNLTLKAPETVNAELLNSGFENGLDGWSTEGSVTIIDRDLVFTTPDSGN